MFKSKTFCCFNYYRKLLKNSHVRRCYSSSDGRNINDIKKIRNIGILAHIDAGKTTTTERMLFYSGTIRSMGEVHHGNTVTDYMEQERQRGITITSAAVSFPWGDGQINLIDTPGHIDFTMEVEQSLAVLDGAVIVLDGSAGVEAQTHTVWRQADSYRVPRLIYLNKMDRADADVDACLSSVRDKLQGETLLLHLPVRHEGKLIGLIDLITLEEIIWTVGRGQQMSRRRVAEGEGRGGAAHGARRRLVDALSAVDDALADAVIRAGSLDLPPQDVSHAVRRATLAMKAFPVLCGSSYKNIGVQPLLDGVLRYLPSPLHKHPLYASFGTDTVARVFKVQHDRQRGALTFLRLYGGTLAKGQKIYNLRQGTTEQVGALFAALADELRPVEGVAAGDIAVVSALKDTMCGDLVTSSPAAAARAKASLASRLRAPEGPARLEALLLPSARQRLQTLEETPSPEDTAELLLGIGTTVPEPVFLCAIEPPSAGSQAALDAALAELRREDPSLRLHTDPDSGQTVLAGMGELHLEVIKERVVREYGIAAELGALHIAYREALAHAARREEVRAGRVGAAAQHVRLTLSAARQQHLPHDKILKLDKSGDSAANMAQATARQLAAVRRGVDSALLHGPKLGCPMVDVQVTLHWLEVGRGTADSAVTAAVALALRKVFEEAGSVLLEPLMALQVVVPESHSARVLADLARRRVDIQHIHIRQQSKVIECLAPLSELLGYSTTLRSLSSGLASFSMQFQQYRAMTPHEEEKAIISVRGF